MNSTQNEDEVDDIISNMIAGINSNSDTSNYIRPSEEEAIGEMRAALLAWRARAENEARINELDHLPAETGIFTNGYYQYRLSELHHTDPKTSAAGRTEEKE